MELSHVYSGTATINYATASDSAVAGSDFLTRSGQLTFLGGQATQTISVPVSGDAADESLERFFVNLTATANATILDGQATGWITDNDQTSHAMPFGAASQDTSEFMLGTVFVTVVFLESDGRIDPNLERFSPGQAAAMKTKIREGLQWWEDVLALQGTVHTLGYTIDFTYADQPIQTPYEPLSRSSADQGLWVTSFLETVGADTAADHRADLDAYNHLRRLEAGTNWAFTLFITNGWNDADGRYPDGANAWAYAGGPYTVIQQHRSEVTVAHEVGHIFYNLDEYPDGRSYFDRRGYYNTQNLNAYEDHPDLSKRVPSLMAETADEAFTNHVSSTPSLEMIGWRDSDTDGIFDVLDVPLTLTGTGAYNAQTSTYRFQGNSAVQTLPNLNPAGLGNDITLNKVSRLQSRINGGAWTDAASYQADSAVIDLTLTVPPNRSLEFRTIDDATGVTSPIFTGDTTVELGTPGITVNPTSGLTTTEGGGSATFTMVLDSQPTADVTIALTSSDTSEGTVSPTSVTFTTANWNASKTITVTGVNDDLDDGDVAYSIVTSPATSTDVNYHNRNADDVSVTNTDNDAVGITVNPTSGLSTTEGGGTASFTIVLNTRPAADVTIGLNSADTSEGTISPASVTFTAANWNTPRMVTVSGVNDELDDGDVTYTIVTTAANSADTDYNSLNAADVSVTNRDNDAAGITVDPAGGLVTTEAGGAAVFTIVLNAQPAADVTIGLTSSDTGEGRVSPASLSFTAANWNTPQTVTVSGVNDDVDDGDTGYTIVTAAATSTDAKYNNLNASGVSVSNTDDDTAGITVSPTSGLSTSEAGGACWPDHSRCVQHGRGLPRDLDRRGDNPNHG